MVIVTTQYTSVKKAIVWPGAQQLLSGKPQILEIRMSFLSVAPGLCLNTHLFDPSVTGIDSVRECLVLVNEFLNATPINILQHL